MQVEYEYTPEELVAFTQYHQTRQPGNRLMPLVVVVMLVVIAATALPGATMRQAMVAIIPLAIIGLVLGGAFWLIPRLQKQKLRRTVNQTQPRSRFGPRQMSANDIGITDAGPSITMLYAWPAIRKIVQTRTHAFFYLAAYNALILPLERVSHGDAQALIDQATTHWENRNEDVSLLPAAGPNAHRLAYPYTPEEAAAFTAYHHRDAKTNWWAFASNLALAGGLAYLALPMLRWPFTPRVWVFLALLVLLVWGAFLSGPFVKKTLADTARSGIKKSFGGYMFGPTQMQIDDAGIAVINQHSKIQYAWSALRQIEENADHAFFYVTEVTALILPKCRVTEGDPAAFLAQARTLWQATGKRQEPLAGG